MSTYVFISRRADPLDDSDIQISAQEWLQCIDAQSDFRQPNEHEKEWLGEHARIWKDYEFPIAFDLSQGQIEVKNPDAPTIAQMKRIAALLSAEVFSENGELFNDEGVHAGFQKGFP